MDASEAVVRLRVGRTGLASFLFAVLRPKDARAAAVNTNALRLTHGSRYTKIPLGDIVAAKVKTVLEAWAAAEPRTSDEGLTVKREIKAIHEAMRRGRHWYGIRFRHAAGEAFVSGLSRGMTPERSRRRW